jgi:hypothetical protein
MVVEYSGVCQRDAASAPVIGRALDVRSLMHYTMPQVCRWLQQTQMMLNRCAAFRPPAMGLAGASGQPGQSNKLPARQASAQCGWLLVSPARPAAPRPRRRQALGRAVAQHGWAGSGEDGKGQVPPPHPRADSDRHSCITGGRCRTCRSRRPTAGRCAAASAAMRSTSAHPDSAVQRRSVHREMTAGLPV